MSSLMLSIQHSLGLPFFCFESSILHTAHCVRFGQLAILSTCPNHRSLRYHGSNSLTAAPFIYGEKSKIRFNTAQLSLYKLPDIHVCTHCFYSRLYQGRPTLLCVETF